MTLAIVAFCYGCLWISLGRLGSTSYYVHRTNSLTGTITSWCYQQTPFSIFFNTRYDGSNISLGYPCSIVLIGCGLLACNET
ncbi:hypothetical protein F4804DRAFT_95768 [Jackrogersella minutella]|nr:hypothetical protein F4804DRAFT_95768 [Jackrogersella minutella]